MRTAKLHMDKTPCKWYDAAVYGKKAEKHVTAGCFCGVCVPLQSAG